MAFRLKWSEEALEDIESIANYIEKDSPFYAKSVVSKIFEKAEILQEFSELGRKVPEFDDETIREILFVAIAHGKRLLENHHKSITSQSSQ